MDASGGGRSSTELRRLIRVQTNEGLGVPVLLRDAAPAADEPEPFGTDAYRLQVALAARFLEGADVTDLAAEGPAARLLARPLLALNFHRIARGNAEVVRRQLGRAAELGATFDLDAPLQAPGELRVLVACYDGFADTAAFAADLCRSLGLRAVFFPLSRAPHADRLLTDAELADLAREHEVGWHTASHASAAEVDEAAVATEVVEPFRRIERATGRPPRIGAWRGGTRFDADLPSNRALRALGVTHLVSNWSVERV